MLGAIIGDMVGSYYEFHTIKTRDFPLFSRKSRPTDDSIMTIAVGVACAEADCRQEAPFKEALVARMRELGRMYRSAGYGGSFYRWLFTDTMGPYNSYGNGSAMRVSPTAYAVDTLKEVQQLAKWSAEVTHNHPEGIKGAQAVASAIFLARTGATKEAIQAYTEQHYYDLSFSLAEIRPGYDFDVTCQGSVPQAIRCFLEAESFEDAIRNAVSLGGDADTQAAMAGAIAEAFFGIPEDLRQEGLRRLDDTLKSYYDRYAEKLYGHSGQ